MFGMTAPATRKRSLSADDTAGVVWVYGVRPPMSGYVSVNAGVAWTASTSVTLTSSVANATQMRFNNDGGAWSSWQPYAASSGWTLAGTQGSRTVNAEYRDAGGNVYASSDTIGYDSSPPRPATPTTARRRRWSPSPHAGRRGQRRRVDRVASRRRRLATGDGVWLRKLAKHKRSGVTVGPHSVDYRSTDAAGNVETFTSRQVTIV